MLKDIGYYFRVLWAFIKNSIMVVAEYRANFLIRIIFHTTWTVVQILFITIIFFNVSSINGWSKYEMLLFLGVDQLIFALFVCLATSSLVKVEQHVLTGTMDYVLTKPINAKFYLSLRHIDLFQVPTIIFALAIMVYAQTKLDLHISISQVFLFLLLVVIGVLLLYSMLLICASFSFKYIKTTYLRNMLYTMIGCMIYPLDIYHGLFKYLVTVIIPVGIIIDFPSRLLAKALTFDKLLYALMVTLVFYLISDLLWKWGLRNYTSASS